MIEWSPKPPEHLDAASPASPAAAADAPASRRDAEPLAWSERLSRLSPLARTAVALGVAAVALGVRMAVVPPEAPYLSRALIVLASAAFVGSIGARLRSAHASLRRANEELVAADRAKSDMVARLQRANVELEAGRSRARASEAILSQAGEMARLGAWWIDLTEGPPPSELDGPGANAPRWSDEVFRIFGYAPGSVEPSNRLFFEHVPPEDRPRIVEALQRAIAERRTYTCEHRLVRADGAVRVVLERADVVVAVDGTPLRLVGAIQDVTERKQAEHELVEADRRKTEFLGMLSHELRNPLAPIRNSIYLLERSDPAGEQARRCRAAIARQAEHLTRLVDDLLDVTRIARGKIELRRGEVDLREIVRRTGEDLRSVLDARGVELSVELAAEPVWVDGDETRLGQVVGNLLQNAAKFTPPGGRVTLALHGSGGVAEIRVRDTGVGIDPDLLGRVFEPFVQAERSLARTQGGLGLGLALVKGIAEMHGGMVRAESAGPGAGAEFTVRLPLSARPGREPAAPGVAPRAAPGRRVLVVDDNADAAASLASLVELFGHTADVAYDGPSAIERARAVRPSVVLCDLGLPGMSGYDVARAIRAEAGAAVELFAVSGYAQPEDVRRAADAGFDRHLAKPLDPGELERLLASPGAPRDR